jgi:hypothetical protein
MSIRSLIKVAAAGCTKSNPTKKERKTCTDYLLFEASLEDFLNHRNGQTGDPLWLDWTDNGRSKSMEYPWALTSTTVV